MAWSCHTIHLHSTAKFCSTPKRNSSGEDLVQPSTHDRKNQRYSYPQTRWEKHTRLPIARKPDQSIACSRPRYNGRRRRRKQFNQAAIKSIWSDAPAKTKGSQDILDPKDLERNLPFCHGLPSREPSPFDDASFLSLQKQPTEIGTFKSRDAYGIHRPSTMTAPFALPIIFPREDGSKFEYHSCSCSSLLFGSVDQRETTRFCDSGPVGSEAAL
jgi:hypothetical protein